MFVPDGLTTNSYRVLGLSVNATSSEVHAAAGRIGRAAALGATATSVSDFPVLGQIRRTDADIRAAVSRLSNPSQRLHDRLFWFHEPIAKSSTNSSAIAGDSIYAPFREHALRHDSALKGLLRAYEAPLDDAGLLVWHRGFREWQIVVSDQEYWAVCWSLEERGGFEPRALASELDALRSNALRLAAGGLTMAGRSALAQDDTAVLARIICAFGELAVTGSWAEIEQSELTAAAVERVRQLCRKVREEGGSRIERSNVAAAANKIACDATFSRYRNEIQPALRSVTQFLPKGKEKENADSLREAAALCLLGLAIDYTWADDFIKSEELHEEALKLATGTLSAIKIEGELAKIRDVARKQRVFGQLSPISDAPSLRTINGFGFGLYGNTDYDKGTDSYAATYYFLGLFIPLCPIARYRVRSAGDGHYSFLGKLPLRKGDRWHQGIAAAAIILMFLFNSGGNSVSSATGQDPILNFDSIVSSAQPDNTSGGVAAIENPLDRFLDSTGGTAEASANDPWSALDSSKLAADQPVPVYSQNSQLSWLKSEIDANRSRMTALDLQIQPKSDDLDRLKARIETLGSELEQLRARHNAQLPVDIDEFNQKVDDYNGLLRRQRARLAAYNSDIDLYNQLVQTDKSLVAQYNALLR